MTEKRYANDWAKAKSRDLLRESIQRNLHFRKPRDMRVLCFPGYDAAEITQVYDPLGIPRSNIFGVERDAEVAEELRRKNLGITIVEKSIEDYVAEEQSLTFDVISLDYTGPLRKQTLHTIKNVVAKQRRNDFVFHIANLVKRDQDAYPFYYQGYLSRLPHQDIPSFNNFDERSQATLERARTLNRQLKEGSIREAKDLGYTSTIMNYTTTIAPALTPLLKAFAGTEYDMLLTRLEQGLNGSIRVVLDRNDPFRSGTKNEVEAQIFGDLLFATLKDLFSRHFRLAGFPPELEASFFGCLTLGTQEKYFLPLEVSRYSYISESGAPMIGDIYYFSYPKRAHEAASEITRTLGIPRGKFNLTQDLFLTALRKPYNIACAEHGRVQEQLRRSKVVLFKERTFLGNSSRPVLTKGRAIDEFRNGATVDDLREKYRCADTKPLAQWKAHVTMGTYDDTVNGDHTDPISKEDALDLIASGIPVEEIVSAFPEPFSIGQLRAFKAHTTMGTYTK